MKLIMTLIAIFLAFYALSSNAANYWDIKTAYRLAVASDCAYRVPKGKSEVRGCFINAFDEARKKGSDALDVFKELPDDAVEIFTTDGKYTNERINAAILVKIRDGAIIAFRGTEGTPQDWLHNIFLTSIDNLSERKLYDGGRHYGFNQSLSTLKEEICKDKKIWQPFVNDPSGKTLYITGHSKGGALATGATVDFTEFFNDKPYKPEVVTYAFEAARFFTAMGESASKPLLDNIWRFEYQYDIVPHVPLGKVTYDFLLKHKSAITILAEKFKLSEDLIKDSIKKVENNNINFVPVGRLVYVDEKDQLKIFSDEQPDQNDSMYYGTRLISSLGNTAMREMTVTLKTSLEELKTGKTSNRGHFVIEQHSNCYLGYLKVKAIDQPVTELSKNCINQ